MLAIGQRRTRAWHKRRCARRARSGSAERHPQPEGGVVADRRGDRERPSAIEAVRPAEEGPVEEGVRVDGGVERVVLDPGQKLSWSSEPNRKRSTTSRPRSTAARRVAPGSRSRPARAGSAGREQRQGGVDPASPPGHGERQRLGEGPLEHERAVEQVHLRVAVQPSVRGRRVSTSTIPPRPSPWSACSRRARTSGRRSSRCSRSSAGRRSGRARAR